MAGSGISVFGLGYVGFISAACLASRGHQVVGVDVNPTKIRAIQDGRAPLVEEGVAELMSAVTASGNLTVTSDPHLAIDHSDVSLVCVGTPSAPNGSLSTAHLERVAQDIGRALRSKDDWHVVVVRSTMLPGTCEEVIVPILEFESAKKVGVDFGLCVNPEYLREGTSIADFFNPPKTVIGESSPRSGDAVAELYEGFPGPVYRVSIRVAEMSKYVDNTFHALKVAFANEIGSVCKSVGIDSHVVMDIFKADRKLNISPAYLTPGFAFGGSCLPKDLRALRYLTTHMDVDAPLISSVLESNAAHIRRVFEMIKSLGRRRVGLFGLAFKGGTDDLRESPLVELAETLIGKGFPVRIYDANVRESHLVGANRAFIEQHLPHLSGLLMDDLQQAIDYSEVCVIGNADPRIHHAVAASASGRVVVDLVRMMGAGEFATVGGYVGVCW
jgi:GDP-mannose 6-dehydrogenase